MRRRHAFAFLYAGAVLTLLVALVGPAVAAPALQTRQLYQAIQVWRVAAARPLRSLTFLAGTSQYDSQGRQIQVRNETRGIEPAPRTALSLIGPLARSSPSNHDTETLSLSQPLWLRGRYFLDVGANGKFEVATDKPFPMKKLQIGRMVGGSFVGLGSATTDSLGVFDFKFVRGELAPATNDQFTHPPSRLHLCRMLAPEESFISTMWRRQRRYIRLNGWDRSFGFVRACLILNTFRRLRPTNLKSYGELIAIPVFKTSTKTKVASRSRLRALAPSNCAVMAGDHFDNGCSQQENYRQSSAGCNHRKSYCQNYSQSRDQNHSRWGKGNNETDDHAFYNLPNGNDHDLCSYCPDL